MAATAPASAADSDEEAPKDERAKHDEAVARSMGDSLAMIAPGLHAVEHKVEGAAADADANDGVEGSEPEPELGLASVTAPAAGAGAVPRPPPAKTAQDALNHLVRVLDEKLGIVTANPNAPSQAQLACFVQKLQADVLPVLNSGLLPGAREAMEAAFRELGWDPRARLLPSRRPRAQPRAYTCAVPSAPASESHCATPPSRRRWSCPCRRWAC